MPKNIYEKGEAESEEKERLKTLDYPNFASEELIGENLRGKVVLDLGAGPNAELGKFVRERGVEYIAYDISEAFLKAQRNEGAPAVRGDVRILPFKDKSVDIAHMRFVLMHLSSEDRERAIQETTRITKERELFVEYDWNAVQGNETIQHFLKLQTALTPKKGINIFMGQTLKEEVERATGTESLKEKRFQEGPGNYAKEWAMLGKTTQKVFGNIPDKALVHELGNVTHKLEEEAQKENPDPSVRPDIVAVEVII